MTRCWFQRFSMFTSTRGKWSNLPIFSNGWNDQLQMMFSRFRNSTHPVTVANKGLVAGILKPSQIFHVILVVTGILGGGGRSNIYLLCYKKVGGFSAPVVLRQELKLVSEGVCEQLKIGWSPSRLRCVCWISSWKTKVVKKHKKLNISYIWRKMLVIFGDC